MPPRKPPSSPPARPRAPRRVPPKPVEPPSVAAAVEKLLAGMELDQAGEMNAAIARALASKLDEAKRSDSGAIAMAISGIAKELRAVVDALLAATGESEEFVADLFAA